MAATAGTTAAAAAGGGAANGSNGSAGSGSYSIKYVFIPADPSEPIEERVMQVPAGDNEEVMCFINMCKRHFQAASRGASTEQEAARRRAFRASLGERAAGVDEQMIDYLSNQQMVEPIALVSNAPQNGFIGVFMYADDQASFKQLPANARATQIAAEAGQALQVCGDVFVSRYFDNEDAFRRLDFTQQELSSAAPWLHEAREQLARRSERSGDTQAMLQRLQQVPSNKGQGPAGGSAGKKQQQQQQQQAPTDAERNLGNAAFRKGDMQTACEHYTAALKLDAGNTAARNNRAQAYLNLAKPAEAAADAAAVVAAEPGNVKGWMRLAAARAGLGQLADAVTAQEKAVQLQPTNAELKQTLAALQARLAAEQQPQAGQQAA